MSLNIAQLLLLSRLMIPFQDQVACHPDPNQEDNISEKLYFLTVHKAGKNGDDDCEHTRKRDLDLLFSLV